MYTSTSLTTLPSLNSLYMIKFLQATLCDNFCAGTIIAERLSARQLILLRISFCVCMYVCMYVTLRNANFLLHNSACAYACMLHTCTARCWPGTRTARCMLAWPNIWGRAERIWPHYCREHQELISCQRILEAETIAWP